MEKVAISTLFVRPKPGHPTRGWLVAGPLAIPVAIGRGGIKANKREGDGGTPRGTGGGPTGWLGQ
jgi:L,D-peptidoglycan transpeptidase YkuD (ErfK/YbiS/YcfS/YnhG family)